MLQVVLIGLGGIVALMGLATLFRGEFNLSGSRTLTGGSALAAALVILAAGAAVIAYALWVLPNTR
jgi:hypothetical protein